MHADLSDEGIDDTFVSAAVAITITTSLSEAGGRPGINEITVNAL
jgi:hypothetical protein